MIDSMYTVRTIRLLTCVTCLDWMSRRLRRRYFYVQPLGNLHARCEMVKMASKIFHLSLSRCLL